MFDEVCTYLPPLVGVSLCLEKSSGKGNESGTSNSVGLEQCDYSSGLELPLLCLWFFTDPIFPYLNMHTKNDFFLEDGVWKCRRDIISLKWWILGLSFYQLENVLQHSVLLYVVW